MRESYETKIAKVEKNNHVVVVGSEFNFWLNEEDDVYDELTRKDESTAGHSLLR